MITTPIFTRLMTTQEYGEFNVFQSWMSIISIVVTLGLYNEVFASGLVKYEEDRKRYASALQGLCTVCILLGLSIYAITHNFWNSILELKTEQVLLMFIMIWETSAFLFWSAYQRVDFKYRALVLVTVISSIAKPVIGVIFVYCSNDKVTARIFAMTIAEVAAFTGLFFSILRKGKILFEKKYWIYALNFNIPLIPHYLSQSILNSSDRIMIQKMVSSETAGIYSLAYSISQIMMIFNSALIRTIEPWLYKKMKANRMQDIGHMAYIMLSLIAVMNLLLIALAPEVVSVFAPVQYHEAIWIIPPVAMGVYFMFAYTFFSCIEFYFGKSKNITYVTLSCALINILLNWICIKLFGYMAAGYTTLVCYMLYTAAHYYFALKICRKVINGVEVYNLKTLLVITSVFMISGFFLMLSYKAPIVRYGILALACFAAVLNQKKIITLMKNMVVTASEK